MAVCSACHSTPYSGSSSRTGDTRCTRAVALLCLLWLMPAVTEKLPGPASCAVTTRTLPSLSAVAMVSGWTWYLY